MPKCIDDPSRSYTGKEPSPKGLGYCAHAHSVGTTKTGNDGNTWTVETTYKGTKRWVKKSGSGKGRSTKRTSKKKTSGKRRSTKRTSKRKTTKRKSIKRTSKRKSTKRKSTKRTSKRKSKRKASPAKKVSGTACTKLPTMTGYGSSVYNFEPGQTYYANSEYAFEPGQRYYLQVLGIDIKEDKDYEKIYNNMVYNPSTFKKKMEKLLCTWTKGKKVTVTKYELSDMDPYNTQKSAGITIFWK